MEPTIHSVAGKLTTKRLRIPPGACKAWSIDRRRASDALGADVELVRMSYGATVPIKAERVS
jgi:hypothetical protein